MTNSSQNEQHLYETPHDEMVSIRLKLILEILDANQIDRPKRVSWDSAQGYNCTDGYTYQFLPGSSKAPAGSETTIFRFKKDNVSAEPEKFSIPAAGPIIN